MLDRRALTMIAVGVMALATLFYILSTALTSWSHYDQSGVSLDIGLWHRCLSGEGQAVCGSWTCADTSYESDCRKLYGARAFMIMACILSVISSVGTFVNLLQNNGNQRLVMAGKSLPAVSLPCGIIGVALGIVFATKTNFGFNVTLKIGAAAIIGIIALVLNLSAAVTAAMIR